MRFILCKVVYTFVRITRVSSNFLTCTTTQQILKHIKLNLFDTNIQADKVSIVHKDKIVVP